MMMNYKDEQKKTRALLKAWKLIKGYDFNADRRNRAKRRRGLNSWDRKLVGENVQTFIKKEAVRLHGSGEDGTNK